MSLVKFGCPRCKQEIEAEDAYSGRQVSCPTCNHIFVAPASPEKKPNWQERVDRVLNKELIPSPPPMPPEPGATLKGCSIFLSVIGVGFALAGFANVEDAPQLAVQKWSAAAAFFFFAILFAIWREVRLLRLGKKD